MDKTNTPDEIIDVVNERDEVIGQTSILKANSDPALTHREVGILLSSADGQVLLQKRNAKKKVNPGKWTITAAGHVPAGMKPEEAAHKELKEELGFDAPLQFIDKVKDDFVLTESRFLYRYKGMYQREKIVLEPREVDAARLFTWLEVEELIRKNEITVGSAKIIRDFFGE